MRHKKGTAFTLLVLILCPVISALAFLVPMRVLAPVSIVICTVYAAAFRPKPSSLLHTLTPAFVYFAVLYLSSAAEALLETIASGGTDGWHNAIDWRHLLLESPFALQAARISLGIAAASIVSTASYTITTDLQRRIALTSAEEAIRHALHLSGHCTFAPAISLLSSFIPMAHRVWHQVDEARRARGMRLVTPATLVTFITVCMQKAVSTLETMRSRE